MHQRRSEIIRGLPLPRKGTKYIARAINYSSRSVSVAVALRDMLKLASTMREVKHMVHNKMLMLNGRPVFDAHQPILPLSIFHADKSYKLTILPTGRFSFEETKDTTRSATIIGKVAIGPKKFQYGLYDGATIAAPEGMRVGDTVIIDFKNKITKHIPLEKGRKAFVISGSNVGKHGSIAHVEGALVTIQLTHEKEDVVLDRSQVVVQ